MRFCFAVLVLLLALPGMARAAIAEAPPRTFGGFAPCVRPTGGGELATTVERGVQLLRATREGVVGGETIALGSVLGCATVVGHSSGAAVAAAAVADRALRVAVREPDGRWGVPGAVADPEGWDARELTAAVSARGDVVVAWSEDRSDASETRIRAVRRAPGGSFGPATVVSTSGPRLWTLLSGVSDSGEAFVLWTAPEGGGPPYRLPVRVAIAAPGEPFAAAAEVGRVPVRSLPALAVGPDGRALVAIPDAGELNVTERPPGGSFGPLAAVAGAPDFFGVKARAALGPDGAGAVTWEGRGQAGAGAATRAGPGPFTAVALAPPGVLGRGGDPFYRSETYFLSTQAGLSFPGVGVDVRLTPDGRAVLAWSRFRNEGATQTYPAYLATLPLGAGTVAPEAIGGTLLDVSNPYALTLPDGAPAVAWTDELLDERYRVRLATADPGGPAAQAPPRIRVGRPVTRVVRRDESLLLPVTCSGPCEVRAQSLDGSYADGFMHRAKAGREWLSVSSGIRPLAPRKLGPVRLRLTYGPADGRSWRTRTVTVRLRRPPDPPEPELLALRAVRRGDHIEVTWRTDTTAAGYAFYVTGDASRGWSGEPLLASVYTGEPSRRVKLRVPNVAGVRWITLRIDALTHAYLAKRTVRVT